MKNINIENLKEQNIDELNNLDENQIEMEREHLDKIAKDLGFGPEVRNLSTAILNVNIWIIG
jgi:hypothetical protein